MSTLIGLVLAAGRGSRLGSLTDDLPKTLLNVAGDSTVLDTIVDNLSESGVSEVRIVTGHCADRIESSVPQIEDRFRVKITTVFNEMGTIWNNAHSLNVGLRNVDDDVLLVNGDTVAPLSVQKALLSAAPTQLVALAIDATKRLGDEEMKVILDSDSKVLKITKQMSPSEASGEYIGAALLRASALDGVRDVLSTCVASDPNLYYEDAFQAYLSDGDVFGHVLDPTEWTEIDDASDLEIARSIGWLRPPR